MHAPIRQPFRHLAFSLILTLVCAAPAVSHAQGSMTLSNNLSGNTQAGVSAPARQGISFELTALKNTRVYRFWTALATGTHTIEIYYNPNGLYSAPGVAHTTGWVLLGSAQTTGLGSGANYAEIPLDLNLHMNQGDVFGFAIRNASGGTLYYTSGTPYIFSDTYLSMNTQGWAGDVPVSFASFYPRRFCGKITYDEGVRGPNDAGIVSIDSPQNFCAGQHDVTVTLQNFGTNQLTSATINWTLNGIAQAPVVWSGLLDTLTQQSRMTSVTLASQLAFAANTPYDIAAWTSSPNGVQDTINTNDSALTTVQAAIAGTFTIGGASPDYATITDAVNDLNQFGVCGPVIFNIRPGTYTEQVDLGAISGTSITNTVIFQSETRSKADVTISFTSQTGNPTIYLNGADHVTFRDLTAIATNPSYAIVVWIQGGSEHCTFENVDMIGVQTTSTSTNLAVVYSPSGSIDHNLTIRNCSIQYGSYGLYLYGGGTTAYEDDVVIEGNTLTGQYYRPMLGYYMQRLRFTDNTIRYLSSYSGGYLTYCYYTPEIAFERNALFSTGGSTRYGSYFYTPTGTDNRIVNNFISIVNNGSGTTYGLYLSTASNSLIAFNTIYLTSTYASSRAIYQTGGANQRFLNNIIYNAGSGYAMYIATTGAVVASDYNVLATSGTSIGYWGGNRADISAWQAASIMDANSITTPVTFRDALDGDLHLAGTSQNDPTLTGSMVAGVSDDIDSDPRILPYRGADEACYILPNTVSYRLVDGENNDIAFATIPGTMHVAIDVSFPDMGFPVTVTVNFYTVPGNVLAASTSFNATKLAGQPLTGSYPISVPSNLAPGYYRMNIVFTTQNSCGDYIAYAPGDAGLLLVGQGQTPCLVWPGDVNNDGIVNYGDRASLNKYIFDANLRPSWLMGPARYRPDYLTNPMTYYTWEAQAGAPWATPDGCFMDADGNGMVNNYDMLPIKVNFLRTHGSWTPKPDEPALAGTFDMTQNYPNPFNPTTTLQYSVPEKSTVKIVVTDLLGRTVMVLVDGVLDAGVRTVTLDASQLDSGMYLARYDATGVASGFSTSRIVKMTLSE